MKDANAAAVIFLEFWQSLFAPRFSSTFVHSTEPECVTHDLVRSIATLKLMMRSDTKIGDDHSMKHGRCSWSLPFMTANINGVYCEENRWGGGSTIINNKPMSVR